MSFSAEELVLNPRGGSLLRRFDGTVRDQSSEGGVGVYFTLTLEFKKFAFLQVEMFSSRENQLIRTVSVASDKCGGEKNYNIALGNLENTSIK